MRRYRLAERQVVYFVPESDNRNGVGVVKSNGGQYLQEGVPVITLKSNGADSVLDSVASPKALICFDEAQFFTAPFIDVLRLFLRRKQEIAVAGLDLDSTGHTFGLMGELLALADNVVKCRGVCMAPVDEVSDELCGAPATRTYRKRGVSEARILIGGFDIYQPRCYTCWCK